jgi:hypothetical protein
MARFVTVDPASGAEAFDELTVEIIGSNEPLSAYCVYSSLSINNAQAAFTYDIPLPSPSPGVRVDYDITSELAGTEEISEMCMGLVHMTVDMVFPDGTIEKLWHEGEEDDETEDSGFWLVQTENTVGGTETKKLTVAVTQEDFIKHG